MDFDLHIHSNYSDGSMMYGMIRKAQDQGLNEVGFADHCNVSERKDLVNCRNKLGFNLDITYERRLEGIKNLREEFDITVHNAVEMDYDAKDEENIEKFLDKAEFDYVIGSVHRLNGANVQIEESFRNMTKREKRQYVDRFFEKTVRLIESEIFDIIAHVDVLERNKYLRGFSTRQHHIKVADALESSNTVPEINSSRVYKDLGKFHPIDPFLQVLKDRGLKFTPGSDSHSPEGLEKGVRNLRQKLEEESMEPVRPRAIR